MAFPKSVCVLLALLIATVSSVHGYTIEVGGSKGWTVNPPEDYNIWATRMRFSVNDTLHFRYNKATDSVLVVSKDDYDRCNPNNPIFRLDGGDSSFTLDRSGPLYFITGNKANCDKGQKIHLIVLTVRNNQQPPTTSLNVSPSTRAESDAASTISLVMISLALLKFIGSV